MNDKNLEVRLRTLTPLWTGGVEAGKVDRIHETGILGSLRWWYEAIVRGLGGQACDPTTPACIYDPDKPNNGLCDVCQVFGATGWRRRFRLEVIQDEASLAWTPPPDTLNIRYTDNTGKTHTPTWYFPANQSDKPRSGNLTIQIQSLAPDFHPEVIAELARFIADWAALGARAQMGFGVIKLEEGHVATHPLYDWLVPLAGGERYPCLPSLRNIFLARILLKNGGQFSEQDTFNLKYDLRQLFANDKRLRHFIMGTVKGERIAAKVKMSRPYGDGLMRVWGWIPEQADVYRNSWDRNAVVGAIYQHLSVNHNLQVWREMNSPRDTAKPNNSDAQAFLRSLLGIKEEDDAA
ncbi:MAG: hypothetical protein BWY25_02073 [Chloroflexi bacterium ADurb.Bin222]|nr:MAG: hypothetical protein BWY25_02073 [Chloroflexi bacterium ADurb.Bin222]